MKTLLLLMGVLVLNGSSLFYSHSSMAQTSTATVQRDDNKIHLQFQNNSLLPGNFILKVKSSEDEKYGVVKFTLFSYGKYNGEYEPGTSIYVMTSKEGESLMKGGEAQGKLLIEVKSADEGKVIKLLP
jgi:phage-related protein